MSHHCNNFKQMMSRRDMLAKCANGFGGLALTSLLSDKAFGNVLGQADEPIVGQGRRDMIPRPGNLPAKAKSVIFLYMDGGPSQVDTFDYKPLLRKYHGQDPAKVIGKIDATQFGNNGTIYGSPWEFQQHGQSGLWVSELFPKVAEMADDLCVINSMVAKFPEHTQANYFLHSGHGLQGRPSMGAWVGYGLGSLNQDLPGFVVLNGGLIPPGGVDCFGSGFLPATYQGNIFAPSAPYLSNINPVEKIASLQTKKLDLISAVDAAYSESLGGQVDAIDSAIQNYEMAFRMQSAVPELLDFGQETEECKELYGFDSKREGAATFGRQCLLARRMVERGVRFIELTCPPVTSDRWDQHGSLEKGHEANAGAVDQGIAGLLKDLKRRGLLDETLVVWGGEFGRTPFAQGANGRDHNPSGFTMWMAGGGIKGGMSYGSTDEWGYRVADKKVDIHDLHATILHQLGIDHKKLTYRFSGRDIRLTDVHGHVIRKILA
ncbi:DUF1501 domain-containing protein [Rubritalea marina]|uniref:DUF1501 domain-containing protein n=1 Tax=Rubritalea marina TaxID=361055 RepID=UPI00037E4D28|nr:DUF1501 domain-containing protein [Rubritalea marina]